MDRVVERPASPSTTNRSSTNSSNSCHSRDYGKPRRSYYRLFPSVEPTPPTSPVSLHHHQRASLRNSSAGGSYRRRSSSEDNGRGARDPQLPSHVLAHLSTSPPKDGRKGSISDISPLRTVQEDGHADAVEEVQPGLSAVERSDRVRALADRSYNNVFNSVLGESTEVCDISADVLAHRGYDRRLRPQGNNATAPAIGLGLEKPGALASEDSRALYQGHARTKPRPNLRIAIVKQTTDQAAPLPPKSAQHSREGSAESSLDGFMQDKLAAREVRVASVALKQSIVPLSADLKVRELTVSSVAGRRRASELLASATPSNNSVDNKTSETADRFHRPTSPSVLPKSSGGRWADIPSLAARYNSRAATPEPYVRTATPEHYAAHAGRPATSQGPVAANATGISHVDRGGSSRAVTPDLTARSALAAARANVAALSNIEAPTWTAGFSEQSRTPGSDLGSISSRKPSHVGIADPVQTLAELAEQCEALHARHASLRAQQQQLSSGIIANLKDQKPGPDYGDMLLNEQLSLAAVSSSIDICFAKLKSLECHREDAIATLVAQATAARRAPSDNYSAMSRKSSLVPSLDSVSRLATGRSTPDLHSLYHTHRPGQITSYSYRSETESQRFRPPLYSRQSSFVNEPGTETELHSDLAANARHPKRLTQIREPPATPESSYDTAGASSTADETDGTQASEPSDSEPEEFLRKPQKTDANRNSAKAVKVLGIGLEDAPVSPLSVRADAIKKKARAPPLELRLDEQSKAESDDVSPLTSSTLNADDPDQLARDLELQLQSFPSAPVRPAPPPPPGQDAAPTETKRNRRYDSPVQRRDTAKSYASAHTINVYFDGPHPHDDLPCFP